MTSGSRAESALQVENERLKAEVAHLRSRLQQVNGSPGEVAVSHVCNFERCYILSMWDRCWCFNGDLTFELLNSRWCCPGRFTGWRLCKWCRHQPQ